MVDMEDIYEEAAQGYDEPDATAACTRGLIRDAWEWLTGPYGIIKDIRFTEIASGVPGIELGATK